MAAQTTVKTMMFDVKANINNAVNRRLTAIDGQLRELTESTEILRNAFLFLSFGLLAAGGMMTRFGKQLQGMADSARDAFANVDWMASVVSTTITGTGESTDTVRDKMFQLGIETQWTATQAGEAMQRLALAGFSAEEAIGATEATLNLAAIGLTDVTTAANITVGVFRGFSYEAKTAAEAAEIMAGVSSELAYAATHSTTTVEELGEALKFTAAAADMVGWSLESVTVALMVGADNMVRAGIAGRALRRSLVQISSLAGRVTDGTMTGTKAMEMYNIEFTDAQGNILDLIDIVEELQIKLKGLTDAQRTAALSAMFGTRAVTLWSALMEKDIELLRQRELALKVAAAKEVMFMKGITDTTAQLKKWRDEVDDGVSYMKWLQEEFGMTLEEAVLLHDVIKDSTLSLEMWNETVEDTAMGSQILKERLKSLKGTMLLLESSIDAMWASIGQELAPILIWWNKLLKSIVDRIAQLPGPLRAVIGGIILLAAVMFLAIGKVTTLAGSTMMLVAALYMLRKEQYRQAYSGSIFTLGLRIMYLSIIDVTNAIWGAVWAYRALIFQMALLLGILYGSWISYENTGNAMYLLIPIIYGLWTAIKLLNAEKKMSWWLSTKIAFGLLVETFRHIKLTIVKWAETAATWALTAATWAFNAALYANPLVWVIVLVLALVAAMVLLWQNLDKVRAFFEWLWEVIVGFFEAVEDKLGAFSDLIEGLIGHSTIPDYFKTGAREINQSLEGMEKRAALSFNRLKGDMSSAFAPEIRARAAVGGEKRVGIINNNFGDVRIGSIHDAEEFGKIVEKSSNKALRRLEFELNAAREGAV